MEKEGNNSHRKRLRRWLRRKFREGNAFSLDITDHEADDDDDEDVGTSGMAFDEENVGFNIGPTRIAKCTVTNPKELRVFVGTWNVAGKSPVGSLAVDVNDWLNLKEAADIYALGFQEIVPLNTSNVLGTENTTQGERWNTIIGKTLNNMNECSSLTSPANVDTYLDGSTMAPHHMGTFQFDLQTTAKSQRTGSQQELNGCYTLLASQKMVGVFISIWIKKEILKRYYISSVKVCSVGCGIMGYLGNKGSVAVSLCIEGTSFCFIAAHLASGEKDGDEVRRNHQVSEIFRRTVFPRPIRSYDDINPLPRTIHGHDRIFWFGDLNYRLYSVEDSSARLLIKKQDWKALRQYDQLKKEQDYGGVFQGWREGDIEFAPTYKYSSSYCNRYSGGIPGRSGEKQRIPAWCDRVLWYGKGVKQLFYVRSESKFSDHRPVSSLFVTEIEMITSTANPPLNPLLVMPNKVMGDEDGKTTLLTLLVKDTKDSSDNSNTTVHSFAISNITH